MVTDKSVASALGSIQDKPLLWQVGAVLAGTVFLAAASYVEVPLVPVPVNMQTLAVTLIGAVYGWRLGALTVIAWLAEAALGMPVLSGGAAGAHHFVGPTAGYLFAFPLVAALTGWLAERGWSGQRPVLAFLSMALGNAVCLVLGGMWLAVVIGPEDAWTFGVVPFLAGGLLKSALGASLLYALSRRKSPKSE